MLHYSLKRIYAAVLTVLAVSIITFFILSIIPGNSAMLTLGTDATAEQLAQLEHSMGLDKPWYIRYFSWLGGLLHLDFGTSQLYGTDVLTLIVQRLPVTLSLAVFSMLISCIFALVLGTISAVRKNGIIDIISRTLMQVGNAVPGFWLGMIFIIYIAMRVKFIPTSGFTSPSESFSQYFASILLPSLVLAIGETGTLLRTVRTSMLQSLQEDYMQMAQARGLPTRLMYVKYALRGALAAPINIAGVQLAKLLGGTVVVESVFSLPGLGRLVLVAVEQRDIALLQGSVMFITMAAVLVCLLVDLLTAAIDPRIRPDEGGNAA